MIRKQARELSELTSVALALADVARPETLRHFRAVTELGNKAGGIGFDPVTEGDQSAERAMRDLIAHRRPDDAILGEEYGTVEGTSGLTWVLDPIDGTRAYLAGAPSWGTLVAVSDEAGPILGLIDQPYVGERFFGGPEGAWLEGPRGRQSLATRPPRPLADAVLLTTFPEIGTSEERAAFERVSTAARLTRFGLDCYGYGLVALGTADLVIEAGLHPYDIQGPMAVVRAAGGVVTNWSGGPAEDGGQVVAAANAEIHEQALELLTS